MNPQDLPTSSSNSPTAPKPTSELGPKLSRVYLVGAPNSGKSTLFNRLTGRSVKTVNYPGSTVELNWGELTLANSSGIAIVDTPGVYSLEPKSPEEEVTLKALKALNEPSQTTAHAVILVLDATQLQRQLTLAQQVALELRSSATPVPLVLAITMLDLLDSPLDESAKIWSQLKLELGAQVVLLPRGGAESDASALERLVQALHGALASKENSVNTKLNEDRTAQVAQAKAWTAELHRAHSTSALRRKTRKIDALLLHPQWGWVFLLGVMTLLFASVFWMAAPMMDAVDGGIGALVEYFAAIEVTSPVAQMAMRFFAEAIVAGVGAVLVFVPQIFILFVILACFEDSGYLARAASLLDRPLRAFGLGGRSFVPLLSGFACAVPAMLAARSINSPRERWLALFVLPLTSCSARLPVYALLLTLLFGADESLWAGLGLTLLYLGSIVVTLGASALAEKWGWWKREASFLILELPPYRRPKLRNLILMAARRTQSYIVRTGPVIMAVSAILWGLTQFPNHQETDAHLRLETSYAGQLGQYIEPIFEPMGGDWRTGLGLMTAFAAREVFVSSLAVIFAGSEDLSTDEAEGMSQLLGKLRDAKSDSGEALFTLSSIIGLILFFMIALQCLSTFSVSWRESGSLKFALLQLICFNLVAYVVSVAAVQGLRAIGLP
ncbi:MAG TPA: ferrous iron transporter B [Pseudobdellovibrionaceae bacterium]|nr:ferrous iron transporter B [Pseudobdellovibrionaceae bacterium]